MTCVFVCISVCICVCIRVCVSMCIICVYLCVFSQLMDVEHFLLGLAEQEVEARSRLQVSSEL